MSDNFNIEIISPEKKLLSDKAISATLPSFEGDMTILINHIPLITFLRPGIIKVHSQKEIEYFVEEGTVELSNNNLTISVYPFSQAKRNPVFLFASKLSKFTNLPGVPVNTSATKKGWDKNL